MNRRRLAVLFSVVLVEMISFSIVVPLLPYLAGDLGASEAQIGLLIATYPLAQLLGAPLLGRLSDRFGRKPVLVASIIGTGLAFVVLATARSLPLLFASRFLDGITGGNINVAQSYISDVTDTKDRGRALGLIGAAFGLGFIAGPALGGLLAGYSYALPAWVGAGLEAANVVAVLVLLPESLGAADRARLAEGPRRPLIDFRGIASAFTHRRTGPVLAIRAGSNLAFAIFQTTFVLWGIAALGLSVRANGLVLAWVGVLSVFTQLWLIGKLTDRFTDDELILAALVAACVGLAAWGFVPSIWWLVALMPVIAVGQSVSNTILTSSLTKSVERAETGRILGLQASVQSFTRIPAPIIGGVLIERVAVWSPGVTAALVVGALIPFAYSTLCVRPGARSCEADFAEDLSRFSPPGA